MNVHYLNCRITQGNGGWYVWHFVTGKKLSPFFSTKQEAVDWINQK